MLQKLPKKQNLLWTILILCVLQIGSIPTSLFAQKLDMAKFSGMKPRAIGPAGMSGRITSIDAVNDNPQIIYAGSASGGLWKSTNEGISWKPIFDNEKASSIGAVKIHQANPDIIWVGTGEGNPRNSCTMGYGIYKSLDAGRTWQAMGLENTKAIHRIIIHPTNPDIVYVAAIGSPWGEHPERGVFKTIDGGKTWEKILFLNNKTGAADMVLDPSNPNKLLVAMWEHFRDPWFFKSGGEASGLYVTLDGGKSWKKRTSEDGLPEGDLGRIGLAIAPSNSNKMYAIVESKKNAMYASEDGGFRWKKVTDKGDFGNRPFYYSEIYVSPKNENLLYSLWTYVSKSEDGGRTWENIADYGNRVHPDHHAWWISPNNPDFMLNGNDGGMNITRDGGKTWQFVDAIPVGQFYHINVDMQTPYNIYGGMQDNGSWYGPAYDWSANGLRNDVFEEILFGDGFDAMSDASNPEYAYAMSQQGNLARVHLKTGQSKALQPAHPEGIDLRFNWNSALAQDPFNKKAIYYGSQFVHYSTDNGYNWKIISPDLTSNDTTKQKQGDSGGLTFDATGAENYTTIVAIAPSPKDEKVIWAGTDDGYLQITQDAGKTWTNVYKNLKGVPAGTWIPQIQASTYKAGEAFVVLEDHRRNNWSPYLYHTQDFGKTWKRLTDESKVWGYALSVVQDPIAPNLLFLGTEFGLYFSIDYGTTWTQWTKDYPTVSTMDMVIQPKEHDLVIGTFGRAIYVLDDIRPLRALAQQGTALFDKPVVAFETPEAVLANYRRGGGARFSAQGMFEGDNRESGAMISYSIKEVKFKEKKKEGEDKEKASVSPTTSKTGMQELPKISKAPSKDTLKITVEILNEKMEVIRTLQDTPKPGINRMRWRLDRKGIRSPNAPEPKEDDAPEPSGPEVLPGEYWVRFTYGDDKDSTKIKVVSDPREQISLTDRIAKNKLIDELMEDMETARKAILQLKEVEKINGMISSNLDAKDDSTKVLRKQSAEVKKKIKSLLEEVNGKEDVQGIVRNPDEITSKLSGAFGFAQSTWEEPNTTQMIRAEQAQKALDEFLKKVNTFFAEDWKNYQKAVEEAKFSLFKNYKAIERK